MLPPSFPQRSRNCGLCGTASDTIPKNHCLRRFPACILLRYRPAITVSIRYDLLKPASPAHSVIKLRDVFTVSFPRASHQPATFCAFPLQLLIPFNTFSFYSFCIISNFIPNVNGQLLFSSLFYTHTCVRPPAYRAALHSYPALLHVR